MSEIIIGKRKIGISNKPYFIADIAANHDGDINRAYRLIELAKEAGADAAKFQNFKAEKIVCKEEFEKIGELSHQSKWKKSVFDVYKEATVPDDWSILLKNKCDETGIEYMTSPYDFDSVKLANNYVNCFKVGSGDITWIDIIKYMASFNKPVLLATGASSMNDVERAMSVLKEEKTVLMQCNTNYTASKENYDFINLNVLKTYAKKYPKAILGLSDHTKSNTTVLAAIALGARVIEKHFTDDCTRIGPDHSFSIMPNEWKQMVLQSEECFFALGGEEKKIENNENQTVIIQRRSVYANKNLKSGQLLCESDLVCLRPVNIDAFLPYEINQVIGRRALKDIKVGEPIKKEDVSC